MSRTTVSVGVVGYAFDGVRRACATTRLSRDTIFLANADARMYDIVIVSADSATAGAYEFSVVPAPNETATLAEDGRLAVQRWP
ncbi:MAG: hypothetical protein ACREJD_14500 [Phycisphaerales bacterium]